MSTVTPIDVGSKPAMEAGKPLNEQTIHLAGQMQDFIDDFTRHFVSNLARQAATAR